MNKLFAKTAFSLKTLASFTLFLIIILLSFYHLNSMDKANRFPIHSVKVYGIQNVDRQEIEKLIKPLVQHGFFSLDVEGVKDRLLQLPWVSKTVVRRVWPNQLVIAIAEKKPLATWNDTSLLSLSGELFQPAPETIPTGLPRLKGPDGEQIQLMQYYAHVNQILQPLHAKIASLELTPDMVWMLTLNNGIKMTIGYKEILTRLQHFVKVYPKIIGDRIQQVEYVDLRYSNGLAVRWKTV